MSPEDRLCAKGALQLELVVDTLLLRYRPALSEQLRNLALAQHRLLLLLLLKQDCVVPTAEVHVSPPRTAPFPPHPRQLLVVLSHSLRRVRGELEARAHLSDGARRVPELAFKALPSHHRTAPYALDKLGVTQVVDVFVRGKAGVGGAEDVYCVALRTQMRHHLKVEQEHDELFEVHRPIRAAHGGPPALRFGAREVERRVVRKELLHRAVVARKEGDDGGRDEIVHDRG
mmetsp:Transcript_2460/g.9027  ORF Transcript_2460/g.9027 Transcript_2460/m.9027 type:complete len:230 (+) Transcript_2460:395-1084(+)